MNVEKKIEALLLEHYPIMPSVGTWPFTVMSFAVGQFEGLSIKPLLGSQIQLIILKRTDFGPADLVDYLINSKEYSNIPQERRHGFLNSYKHRLQDDKELSRWCEQIISLSIGITMELFRRNEMEIRPVLAELEEVDSHFGFHCKNLQTYQLFDVIQLHDAETR